VTTDANPLTEPDRPFDPAAAQRVAAYLERFHGSGPIDFSIPVSPGQPLHDLRAADLREVLRQFAYAKESRDELAEKCATYRSQRDQYHARFDQAANLVLSLFAHLTGEAGACRVPPHRGEECPRPAALTFLRTLAANQKPKDPTS
jgi:hypothetical protein